MSVEPNSTKFGKMSDLEVSDGQRQPAFLASNSDNDGINQRPIVVSSILLRELGVVVQW